MSHYYSEFVNCFINFKWLVMVFIKVFYSTVIYIIINFMLSYCYKNNNNQNITSKNVIHDFSPYKSSMCQKSYGDVVKYD